jgi:predicted GIY-YIG superfamily endonuclease
MRNLCHPGIHGCFSAGIENMKPFAVYILCNKHNGTLYIGITNNLQRRMLEHKNAVVESFTKRYGLTQLVHVELYSYVNDVLLGTSGSRVLARDDKNSVQDG